MTLKSDKLLSDTLTAVAHECIDGIHLNGRNRIHNLRQRGYSDEQIKEIQRRVNKMMKGR